MFPRPLTPVQHWAGALKIAATVRLTSTLCFWLGHQGLTGLSRI